MGSGLSSGLGSGRGRTRRGPTPRRGSLPRVQEIGLEEGIGWEIVEATGWEIAEETGWEIVEETGWEIVEEIGWEIVVGTVWTVDPDEITSWEGMVAWAVEESETGKGGHLFPEAAIAPPAAVALAVVDLVADPTTSS